MNKPTIRIDFVSDVVCPWCYIGKRRLEKAISQLENQFDFDLHFRPFELNPQMPKQGVDQKSYLTQKFGSTERYEQITQQVTQVAAQEGLRFNFSIQNVSPNTRDAHRLLWLAELEGTQPKVKEAFMKAYFEEGKNLSNSAELLEVATRAGLDPEKAKQVLDGDLYLKEVKEAEAVSMKRGVSGVPFFIINDQYGISGAQPVEVFIDALKEIGSEIQSAGNACDVETEIC